MRWAALVLTLLAACSKKEEDAPKVAGGDPDEGGQVAKTENLAQLPADKAARERKAAEMPPETNTRGAVPAEAKPPEPTVGHGGGDPYAVGSTRLPGRKQIVPNVKLGTVKVDGALPKEVVARIVRQHFPEYRYCYEQWLRDDNAAKGTLGAHFTITSTGNVTNAEVQKKLHDSVDPCVLTRLQAIQFPKPEKGTVDVTISLELSVTEH